MLSPSQAFFLQCLSDFLNDKPTRSPDGPVNWQELFETAAAHSLAGLLFHRCKDLLPESDKRKQRQLFAQNNGGFRSGKHPVEADRSGGMRADRFPAADFPWLQV